MNKFFLSTLLLVMLAVNVNAGCMREPRAVVWEGNVIDIYIPIAPGVTRIMLPEKGIKGFQASNTEGILYQRPNVSSIPNQILLSTDDINYQGLVMLDGQSGETYTFNVIASNDDCDSQVKVIKQQKGEINRNASEFSKGKVNKKRRSLIYYMYRDEIPRGFKALKFKGEPSKRLVLQQGSVKFYAEKQYSSRKLTGTIFKLVNEGREAFRIDIESINYANEGIKNAFGSVEMIGMAPFDFILGPAPEKVNDLYTGPKNYGFLFVVSKK